MRQGRTVLASWDPRCPRPREPQGLAARPELHLVLHLVGREDVEEFWAGGQPRPKFMSLWNLRVL